MTIDGGSSLRWAGVCVCWLFECFRGSSSTASRRSWGWLTRLSCVSSTGEISVQWQTVDKMMAEKITSDFKSAIGEHKNSLQRGNQMIPHKCCFKQAFIEIYGIFRGPYKLLLIWPQLFTTHSKQQWLCTAIGMYLHGFQKHILPDINKPSSLGVRWEQIETWATGQLNSHEIKTQPWLGVC